MYILMYVCVCTRMRVCILSTGLTAYLNLLLYARSLATTLRSSQLCRKRRYLSRNLGRYFTNQGMGILRGGSLTSGTDLLASALSVHDATQRKVGKKGQYQSQKQNDEKTFGERQIERKVYVGEG